MPKNFISNKDESARMFESDFLESLSKVHWSVPLFVFIPVVIYSLHNSIFVSENSIVSTSLMFVIGLVIWSFIEYFLHRFVFHYNPTSKIGKRIHFMFHGVHHDYPKDSRRLVMPPSVSVPLASLFYLLFFLVFSQEQVMGIFAGFISGYLAYDMIHYAIHYYNTKNKFWLSIKNHHMKHHYQDPDKGYGVSQPIWDYIFGTTFTKD